jgi:hypothetical protein
LQLATSYHKQLPLYPPPHSVAAHSYLLGIVKVACHLHLFAVMFECFTIEARQAFYASYPYVTGIVGGYGTHYSMQQPIVYGIVGKTLSIVPRQPAHGTYPKVPGFVLCQTGSLRLNEAILYRQVMKMVFLCPCTQWQYK